MENVIKQGYLRKSFVNDRGLSGLLERIDPTKWFVLLVRDGVPWLEYYDKEMDVFSAEPINRFNLSSCQKLAYTQIRNAQIHRFSVVLQERVLELATPNRVKMMEWYNVLESTLATLGILQKEDHDHVYSFCPAVVNFGPSSRQDKAKEEEEDDVFATVGDAEMHEKMKRKESADQVSVAQALPHRTSMISSTDLDISSDYSGDFIDSDFWQKNKKIEIKNMLSCDAYNNKPIPAVRKSLDEINNNQTEKGIARDSNGVQDEPSAVSDDDAAYDNVTHASVPLATCSIASTNSQGNCSKKSKGIEIVTLTSECSAQHSTNSRCVADDAPSNRSSSQEQTIPQNENFYSEFPVSVLCSESMTNDVENVSKSLSSDTHVKQFTSSASAWETFDDVACKSAAFNSADSTSSDSCFVRDKLRHSTGSSKSHVSENTSAANAQISRRSMISHIDPPVPPRLDSLPKRSFTVVDRTKNKFAKSLLADCWGPGANGAPPLPPRRIDSVEGNHSPPPLPSRNFQSSVKSSKSQFKSSDPPHLPNRPCPTREAEGACAMTPARQLSLKMKLDHSNAINVVSLKQSQVEILEGEMSSKSIVITLKQKNCLGLAFVETCGSVWIAGWNQKDYPKLYNQFHVGDQVKTINGVSVFTVITVMKEIKKDGSTWGTVKIEVQRLPHALVLSIRRSAEGQSLGIKREGGTGEIVYVDPNGLAARSGLTSKASYLFSDTPCNWFITEINSRPVSLFFKEMEIEHRLDAVGKEISMVVQPSLFINDIKKCLKKIKNHKSYIVK